MLEYNYEEAIAVLETSLANAKEKLVRALGGWMAWVGRQPLSS